MAGVIDQNDLNIPIRIRDLDDPDLVIYRQLVLGPAIDADA